MKDKNNIIINEVEKIRKLNNKNWMNLLRIAIKFSPAESKKVLKNINLNDKKISKLLSKIK
tara:strand:+ start:274 stop:456 length:183 start_codon:yes stop_codon:yes gene_type:complete